MYDCLHYVSKNGFHIFPKYFPSFDTQFEMAGILEGEKAWERAFHTALFGIRFQISKMKRNGPGDSIGNNQVCNEDCDPAFIDSIDTSVRC